MASDEAKREHGQSGPRHQLADALRREEVIATVAKLEGLAARSPEAKAIVDHLHRLIGPAERRAFAGVDVLLHFFRCEPATAWTYRRRRP